MKQPDILEPLATEDIGPGEKLKQGLSRRLLFVLAVACGLIVANNYYAQPLLENIAAGFHTSSGTAGLLVTFTQFGYATGLLFLVPLGDLLDPPKLILLLLSGTIVTLLASYFTPGILALMCTGFVMGTTTVSAQLLVPFAANLALPHERGKVIGTVMSGLLLGILLARTLAGIVAQFQGWRNVYGLAALLMILLWFILRKELPRHRLPTQKLTLKSYTTLLRSISIILREEPLLRRKAIYGALVFAAFSVFWTSLAFHLSRPPFGYQQLTIGLFGLLGAGGALSASVAGRLADRGWARYITGGFLLILLLSFGFLASGTKVVWPLIIGTIILDSGVQGTHITNQSSIYQLRPEARSRLTTAYMSIYFVGGALGSASSGLAYEHFGWWGICFLGGFYTLVALLYWLTEFRPG